MIYDLADGLKRCGWVSYCKGLSVSSIQLGDPLGLPIDFLGGRVCFSHYACGGSAGARSPGRGAASRGAGGLQTQPGITPLQSLPGQAGTRWVPVPSSRTELPSLLPAMSPASFGMEWAVVSPLPSARSPPPPAWEEKVDFSSNSTSPSLVKQRRGKSPSRESS